MNRASTVVDPAHSTDTMFHAAHRALTDAFPTTLVVSLHGTAQDVAYIGDGTRALGTSNVVSSWVAELSVAFADVEMRSCDRYDATLEGPWLCGTTNVQGRSLNGAADECTVSATESLGRFIHLEQPRSMRAEPAKTAEAVLRTLLP